jgi:putative ABC transport system permease protein
MNPDRFLGMAFEALALNKARSALTMLGIVIGVLSVIVMIGLGQASQAYITNQVKGLGAGVLVVTPGSPKSQNFMAQGLALQTLTLDDARALEGLPGVRFVSPNGVMMTVVQAGRNTSNATVEGVAPAIRDVLGFEVAHGRFFDQQEARSGARVIVLGSEVARRLYAGTLAEPLGTPVRIGTQRFKVIGVLAPQGGGALGSRDDLAFMPTRTFQAYLKGGKRLNSIMVKADSEDQISVLIMQARAILRARHALRPADEDDFKIQTQAELLEMVGTITQVFTGLLAGIAAISLLVGGIGIMNIMLVSVTERTREIGIRKSIGARRRDILAQFLVEASTLSLAGGLVGIALGLALTWVATRGLGLPFVASPAAIAGGFAFSAAVGIFFGIVPANKASRLDPVEALRFE